MLRLAQAQARYPRQCHPGQGQRPGL